MEPEDLNIFIIFLSISIYVQVLCVIRKWRRLVVWLWADIFEALFSELLFDSMTQLSVTSEECNGAACG